jgi:cellulose synthase/poly-beta-1,6-N-acetylglucosamine synthase-like glycosyltransferase
MNAGLNATRYPHVLVASRNVVFAQDALLRLTRPFLLDRSVAVVACSLRAAHGGKVERGQFEPGPARGWVSGCQTIEYLRNFLLQRLGWNRIASNVIFPGSTALFKREHVFAVGGFRRDAGMPKLDMAVRLHRGLADMGINPQMQVIPDQIAWSRVPEELAGIARARRGWQRSLWHTLRENLGLFANPEFGAFGLLAIPYFWLAIIIAPFLELIGYAGLVIGIARGALDAPFIVAYLAASVGYGMLLSVWTVIIQALMFQRSGQRTEIIRLFAFAVLESFGYRQIMAWFRASAYFVDRSPSRNHG